jgi:hypothetical protein
LYNMVRPLMKHPFDVERLGKRLVWKGVLGYYMKINNGELSSWPLCYSVDVAIR